MVKIDNIILHDSSRNREVPVTFYIPDTNNKIKQQLIIFSHGYYENKGGSNLKYSYLTKFLASTTTSAWSAGITAIRI
ncbi:hypothetical protein [Flavobacterium sp.]|uniref:hypothetical protein n=1 Tax=Flavobacterium sp. TaxID=239 RepID=UPI0032638D2D